MPHGGTVSAGLSPVAATLAPDAIARFLDARPLVRLRIVEGTPSLLVPLVRDETLDFAIVVEDAGHPGPRSRVQALLSDRMAIACRRGHPLRKVGSLSDLAEARWLGLNAPGSGGWLEKTFTAFGLVFPPRLRAVRVVSLRVRARWPGRMPSWPSRRRC